MATIRKRGDSWSVQVRRNGVSESKTFSTKMEAQIWATKLESDIMSDKRGNVPDKTFGDLLTRYSEEVTPTKRGARWETVRIKMYLNDPIAYVNLRNLNETHFAAWRDRRLQTVSNASVLREWNILSNACKVAVNEWKWLTNHPMKTVKKPEKADARDRIHEESELDAMIQCSGYKPNEPLTSKTLFAMAAYLFSTETALRAGEVAALDWHEVFLDKGYLKVTGIKPGARKNKAAVRDVPLTPRAKEILEQVKLTHSTGSVFTVCQTSLDALFRKVRDRANIQNLHFHDSRHAAITALSKRYDALALARIVGHTNIKELMTYYNPTIEDLVARVQ